MGMDYLQSWEGQISKQEVGLLLKKWERTLRWDIGINYSVS